MSVSAGIYELRSMLDQTMVVTGYGYTPVKGANIALFANDDGNNRKWRLAQDGQGRWRLQNVSTGLYMTLGVNVPVQGANVRQWTSSANAIQYWNIIETGETVDIDGYTCPVVKLGNYYDGAGTTWMLDVDNAMTSSNSNMEVNRTSTSASQTFALFATTPLNNSIQTPSGIGIARAIGETPTRALPSAPKVYPAWIMPTSWSTGSSNYIEWRYSSRTLSAANVWSAWSGWTTWAQAVVVTRNGTAWVEDGLPGTVSGKAIQYQIQARSVAVASSGNQHSRTSAAVVEVDFAPTVSVTGVEWGPDGLEISYTSDYSAGTLDFDIASVKSDGMELLQGRHNTGFVAPSGSVTIPAGKVSSVPAQGGTAAVVMATSTDLMRTTAKQTYNAPFTIAQTTIQLELEAGDVSDIGIVRATASAEAELWIVVSGRAVPLGPGTSWDVPVPYDEPFELRAIARSGVDWGTDVVSYPDGIQAAARAHAWLGAAGPVALALRRDGVAEQAVEATTEPSVAYLAGRRRPSVFFGTAYGVLRPVSAVIVEGETASWEDVQALIGTRCIYRPPYGAPVEVAVTGATLERTLRTGNVAIEQEEVDQ